MNVPEQEKSKEWLEQWRMFQDDERFLFEEWIQPATYDDFADKTVLECGCGGGQHTSYVAPVAKSVTALDLNTTELARERNRQFDNIVFMECDIASVDLSQQFDVVFCIGVIHHTDDPDRTFGNIYRHCKPGGKIIIWTYSAEGNGLVRWMVEPIRKLFFRKISRATLKNISRVITAILYVPVYAVYTIPFLTFLPYYAYFGNFRKLSFERNMLNVFDKLNAPQTRFTTRNKCSQWFSEDRFEPGTISIKAYKGVSYSLVGQKRA